MLLREVCSEQARVTHTHSSQVVQPSKMWGMLGRLTADMMRILNRVCVREWLLTILCLSAYKFILYLSNIMTKWLNAASEINVWQASSPCESEFDAFMMTTGRTESRNCHKCTSERWRNSRWKEIIIKWKQTEKEINRIYWRMWRCCYSKVPIMCGADSTLLTATSFFLYPQSSQ